MDVFELILDEESVESGVEAISVVSDPAIEEDFIALSKQGLVQLAEVDTERRILMGAVLIPEKRIKRKRGEDVYEVYFSKDTVRKVAEFFMRKGNQSKSTLEHAIGLDGMTVVETWIKEDEEKDKSAKYDLKAPVGSWMVSMKVYNDAVWDEYVKTGKVKGFSIEGYFKEVAREKSKSDKSELSKILEEADEAFAHELIEMSVASIRKDKRLKGGQKVEMRSYNDYPESVKNNAKRGIRLNELVNNKCATQVGKIRAQQLADGEPISKETIQRMVSYLSRAEEYYNPDDTEACGTISYLLWGGKSALTWAEAKLKSIENEA